MSPILFEGSIFLAKSSYLSNSAKILAVLSGMLLLANTLTALGSMGNIAYLSRLSSSFSNLCLYVVLIAGYVAFNGEAVCHKRYRNRKRKRLMGAFKLLLFFCFILRYIKGLPEGIAMSIPAETAGGIIARVLMSLLSTAGSYGFLFCAISLWYLIRDKESPKLLLPEIVSFMVGVLYNGFKFLNYAAGKYEITALGEGFAAFFSQDEIAYLLCIFQFLFNLIMFICVTVYYSKKGEQEQKILDGNVKELKKARNVLKEEGFGIDTLEDDFLLKEEI